MLTWKGFDDDKKLNLSEKVLSQILDTFHNGFGIKGWSIAGVKKGLNSCTHLYLLIDETENIQGYAMYVIPKVKLLGKLLLWEDSVCIKKPFQGYGYSKSVINLAIETAAKDTLGWIGGRTQNPLVMKRYDRFGITFPFHQSYTSATGKIVMRFLETHIREARDVENLDTAIGICKQVYHEGRLGDYSLDVQGTQKYLELLERNGFEANKGDAVLVLSQLS